MASEVEEITDFVLVEGDGLYSSDKRDQILRVVAKHLEYGTFILLRDEKGVAACVRWNWEPNGVCFVLDCIIRHDLRDKKGELIKRIILLGVQHNPHCRFIKFGRFKKYPNRNPRVYSLTEIFKRR